MGDVEIIFLNTTIAYKLLFVFVFDIIRLKTYSDGDANQRITQLWPKPLIWRNFLNDRFCWEIHLSCVLNIKIKIIEKGGIAHLFDINDKVHFWVLYKQCLRIVVIMPFYLFLMGQTTEVHVQY